MDLLVLIVNKLNLFLSAQFFRENDGRPVIQSNEHQNEGGKTLPQKTAGEEQVFTVGIFSVLGGLPL